MQEYLPLRLTEAQSPVPNPEGRERHHMELLGHAVEDLRGPGHLGLMQADEVAEEVRMVAAGEALMLLGARQHDAVGIYDDGMACPPECQGADKLHERLRL